MQPSRCLLHATRLVEAWTSSEEMSMAGALAIRNTDAGTSRDEPHNFMSKLVTGQMHAANRDFLLHCRFSVNGKSQSVDV